MTEKTGRRPCGVIRGGTVLKNSDIGIRRCSIPRRRAADPHFGMETEGPVTVDNDALQN